MPFLPARGLCAATLATAALVAQATPPATLPADRAGRPDPTRANAAVPPLQHRSALQTYRRHGDQPLGDWRAANDEVTRIGGWRTYLREAHAPEAPAPTPDPAAARPGGPASGPATSPAASPAARSPSTAGDPQSHGHGHGHPHHGGRR